jgi:hypothetical protein
MPIESNLNFEARNAELNKRPLYLLIIEGLLEPLASFRQEDAQVTWGGYGVSGYGTTPYGY